MAAFSILALKGIMVERDCESQLTGFSDGVPEGRKYINRSNVVIAVI